jgi:hypothetical protein
MLETSHRSPVSGIDLTDALRGVLVVAALEAPLVAALFWGPQVAIMLVVAAAPFATFVVLHSTGEDVGLPVLPGLFISAAFGLFFGAGTIAWALGHGTPAIGAGIVDATDATHLMAALAGVTVAVLIGEKLGDRSGPIAPIEKAHLFAVSQVLFALSALGVVWTVAHLGGWQDAASVLRTHNKQELVIAAQTLGLALWTVFGLPALIALGVVVLGHAWSRRARLMASSELGLLALAAIALFGSRLLLTLAAVGIAGATYGARRVRIRLRTVGVGVCIFLAVSTVVLTEREGSHNDPGRSAVQNQLQTLGYGMFDVALAVWNERETLRPAYTDPERVGAIGASMLPLVGPRGANLTQERYDVITARAVGGAQHVDTTGFPPSFPTAALVALGPVLAVALALSSGYGAAAAAAALRRRPNSYSCLFLGLLYAFVLNAFKDGDLVLNAAAEFKRWLYVGAVVLAAVLIHSSRERHA